MKLIVFDYLKVSINHLIHYFSKIEFEKVEEIIFIEHKVKRGESLWLIAHKYGIRVKDIVSINKLGNAKYIRPGQRLQIPTDGYSQYRKNSMVNSSKY